MKTPSRSQRGFSLIELLIVVAIIGIIAGIAVPYLEHARQATMSSSAVASMRMIHSAQASHRSATGTYGTLIQLGNAGYIADPNLSGGAKSGYIFVITSATALDYEAVADPIIDPSNSYQHYYINATGIIRVQVGAVATSANNPIN